MEEETRKFDDWLKLIVVEVRHAYFRGFSTRFKLYVKKPEEVGNDLGRFYSHGENSDEPFIEISSNLLVEVWRSEAVESRDRPFYYPVVLKNSHALKRCGCENKTVCDAWYLLIDTLVHELTHLYCDREYKDCDEHKEWCARYSGHSPHFLYHAMLRDVNLNGVFGVWPILKGVCGEIQTGWNPSIGTFEDFRPRKDVKGSIKPLFPEPKRDTVEPRNEAKTSKEAEENQADEDYFEELEDVPLGIGA